MTRWGTEPVIDLSNAPCNAPSPVPIYVNDWWGCEFIFTPNIEARLNILWGELSPDGQNITDSNNNTIQQYSSWPVAGGLAHVVPHLGPYMRVFVDTAGGAPGLFDLMIRHTNRKTNGADFQPMPLTVVAGVMAPGVTKFPITPYIGPAFVVPYPGLAANAIQIVGHDATTPATLVVADINTWGPIAGYEITPRRSWLPELNNELWFSNNTGGPVQMSCTITPISEH